MLFLILRCVIDCQMSVVRFRHVVLIPLTNAWTYTLLVGIVVTINRQTSEYSHTICFWGPNLMSKQIYHQASRHCDEKLFFGYKNLPYFFIATVISMLRDLLLRGIFWSRYQKDCVQRKTHSGENQQISNRRFRKAVKIS